MGIFSLGSLKMKFWKMKFKELKPRNKFKKKSLDELKLQIQTTKEIYSLNEIGK